MDPTDIVHALGFVTRAQLAAIVRQARARITDEDHWCRGRLATTAQNISVDPEDNRASRWCAVGALRAELHTAALSTGPGWRTYRQHLGDGLNAALVGFFADAERPADPYGRSAETLAIEILEFRNDDQTYHLAYDDPQAGGHGAVLFVLENLITWIEEFMPAWISGAREVPHVG